MTQSPQKIQTEITLDLKYDIILEQSQLKRKFALSRDLSNLYILNWDETIIFEYSITYDKIKQKGSWEIAREIFSEKSKEDEFAEQYGKYLNGANKVLVANASLEIPNICQVKIRDMITKTYKFTKRISRIGVRDALR